MGRGEQSGTPEDERNERRQALSRLFSRLPVGYEDRHEALRQIRASFQANLAAALLPALRAHVRLQPQATHSDRCALTSAMLEDLQQLGLCVATPATGDRAELVSLDSHEDPSNRYRFMIRSASGGRWPAEAVPDLSDLQLIPADPAPGDRLFPWPSASPRWPAR